MKIKRFEAAGLKCVEVAPSDVESRSNLPLFITLHGLGDWGESFVDFAPMINQTEYRYVFPTAASPLPGARFQWFRFDPRNFFAGILEARQTITRLLNALAERYQTPANRIVLGGFSQGAMLTLDAGLRYRDKNGQRLAGLIDLSGMLVVDSTVLPDFMSRDFSNYYANASGDIKEVLKSAAADQLPVLVAHGSRDMVVPVTAERDSVALLKGAGLSVEYSEFNYGHEINYETLNLIRQFLAKVLKP